MRVARETERKLAAILSADVAGYSRLMGEDEEGTHRTLVAHRRVTDGLITTHRGRIVDTAGDSILAEFPSAVEAVACAVEIQRDLEAANAQLPAARQMRFRIGINLGDVIVDGDDLFGEGVNIAARLQAIAEPGGICISANVREQVRGKLSLTYRALGRKKVKNIALPVEAYAVVAEVASRAAGRRGPPRTVALGAAVLCAGAIALVLLTLRQTTGDAFFRGPAPGASPTAAPAAEPMVAVLPFANRSGDPAQDYFSNGLTEDLITALGRFSGLSVLAYGAVVPFKGGSPSPDEVRRALNAAYLVEGSVRTAGQRVRVTARLTDAASGVQLWSDQFDADLREVFSVQDEITRRIASALASRVGRIEREQAFAKPTQSLAAYDYLLRGRELMAMGTRAANLEARAIFERAIEQDPRYASAYAALGWTYHEEAKSGWTEFPEDAIAEAERLASKALELDDSSAEAHRLLASVYRFRGQYDLALRELDRAIQINPSDAASEAARGSVLMFSGRSEEAISALETARRLNPRLSGGATMSLGLAYYLQGRDGDATRVLEHGLSRISNPLWRAYSFIGLAAAYAQLDRMEDAARAESEALKLLPFFDVETFLAQFARADRERLATGLRKAGLT